MGRPAARRLRQPARCRRHRWTPTGCRSPRTASSRRRRACWRRPTGMYYWTTDGRQILDGVAGLWCVNAGHGRPKIVEAIRTQAAELDFAPPFQMGHPQGLRAGRAPGRRSRPTGSNKVFFTNSGSESVDTALKMALAYHRVRGEGHAHPADRPRARLPRRQLRRHLGRRHGRQPQDVRRAARRRRPPPPHARPGAQRLQRGQPRARRRTRRRPGAPGRAARRVDHRRGDRRADRRLHRRAGAAAGLSAAAARDLRQARHPADLRRGHHRLRPHSARRSRPHASASRPT